MAKRDTTVVAVIGNLTDSEAANIQADIVKSKRKRTDKGTGTIAIGGKGDVGALIQRNYKLIEKR